MREIIQYTVTHKYKGMGVMTFCIKDNTEEMHGYLLHPRYSEKNYCSKVKYVEKVLSNICCERPEQRERETDVLKET